jgi:hypothetical protein
VRAVAGGAHHDAGADLLLLAPEAV